MYYQQYYYVDKLMRAALYGTKEELLQALRLVNRSNALGCGESRDLIDYRMTAICQVRQILIRRGDSEALAAFREMCDGSAEKDGYLSYANVKKFPLLILSACLYGNDEMLRHILVRCSNYRELLRYQYFHNPLYILMLCKKYDIIAEVLEKFKKNDYDSSFGGGYAIRSLFEMAVVFREERMLRMLLEVFSWTDFRVIIPELALFPEGVEYIAEKFYTYVEFEKRDEPPTLSEFLNAEHMYGTKLKLLHNVYRELESELLDYYLERISPVSVMISTDYTFSEIYESGHTIEEVGRIFADEVTILYRSGNNWFSVDKYRRLFKGHKLIFDLSDADASDIRYNTAEELRYLLAHSVNVPVSDGISPMTELFLDCGSRRMVSLMISKGIINRDNCGEAAVFLAKNKRLSALDEINKADL